MARIVFASLAVMILAVFSSDSFAQGSANQNAYSFLFVQTATSMSYKDGKLTLRNVSPSMVFFSDRPERVAGHFPTTHFLKMWDVGKDNFKNDPPNANLSIIGEKEGTTDVDVVVELMNPTLSEKGDITYDVRILDGNMPAEGGLTSLFIDWWVAPDGAVCHYNWYTGYRVCRFPGPYYWGPYPRRYWYY